MFGCTKLGCGKSAGCWRALRCQLPAAQQTTAALDSHSSPAPNHGTPAASPCADGVAAAGDCGDAGDWAAAAAAVPAAADPWAAAGASDFTADSPTVTTLSACNAFDFSDLTSALAAAGQQPAAAAAKQKPSSSRWTQQQPSEAAATTAATAVCCRGAAGPALPEFFLYAEAEPGVLQGVGWLKTSLATSGLL